MYYSARFDAKNIFEITQKTLDTARESPHTESVESRRQAAGKRKKMTQISSINSAAIQEFAAEVGATEARHIASGADSHGNSATLYGITRRDGVEVLVLNTNGEPVLEGEDGWAKTLGMYGIFLRK